MSKHLQKEVDKLKKKLLALSAMIEESVSKAVRSVSDRNVELANEVITKDREVDLIEIDIEEDCLKILALYQPVAVDLRFVVAVLKINNDLERIGDLAVNIAQRCILLTKEKPLEMPFDLEGMVTKTRAMLKTALDSLIEQDTHKANQVCLADDEVDALNRRMRTLVRDGIRKEPACVEPYIYYLTIARQLERIADYATNIAEDVIYMIEGTIVRHLTKR